MSTDLTGLAPVSLEAWRGVCEKTLAEINAETGNETEAEIADQQQQRQSWQEDLNAVNARIA